MSDDKNQGQDKDQDKDQGQTWPDPKETWLTTEQALKETKWFRK